MMRIALLDESPTGPWHVAEALAAALEASVVRLRDPGEARSSPQAAEVDAVVVRCSAQTASPCNLIGEARAAWAGVPLILVSAPAAEPRLSAVESEVDGWIAESGAYPARLAATLRSVVERHLHARQLEALNAIAADVSRSLNPTHVLDAALDHVTDALRVEAGGIRLLEGHPPRLRLRAWRGLPEEVVNTVGDLAVGEGLCGTIMSTGQPLLAEDLSADSRLACAAFSQAGLRCFAGAPLHVGGPALGTLWVLSRLRRIVSDPLPFLVTVGNQVGTAIENARLYQEARAARIEWEATFDAIDDAISIQDRNHNVLRANRAFLRLVGREARQAIAAKCYELVHGLRAPPEDCACRRLLDAERPQTMAIHLPGSERQWVCSSYPLRDRDGAVDGLVHVFHDVTEERRLQAQAARADRLAAAGELAAGVAHELNNPLTAVTGLADLLLREAGSLPPKVGSELASIAQEASRAARIVKNLVAVSRQGAIAVRPVDLHACVRQSLELFERQCPGDTVRVETDFHSQLPWVVGDFDRLRQVFVNLLSNARHALGEAKGGVLAVRTAADGTRIRIEIEDTGPGIPEEDADRIFDPLFTTKKVGEGTGLGLSVCHGIVAEHGGRIELRNRPGGGALAVVELPRAHEPGQALQPATLPAGEPARPVEGRVGTPPHRGSTSGARVLVVDDEPLVRRFMLRTLEMAGHGAAGARNAEQAVRLLREQRFDLVICDPNVTPTGPGRSFFHALLDERPDLARRIILCTGDPACASRADFACGAAKQAAARCLLKPFTAEQLLRATHEQLTAARGPRSSSERGGPADEGGPAT